jgi:predicted esterase
MKKHFPTFPVLLLLLIISSCRLNKNTLPDNAASSAADWFINPTPLKARQLLEWKLSAECMDSLLAVSRFCDTVPGAHTVSLKDANGVFYSLGILPVNTYSRDSLYPLVIYLHGGTGTELNTKGETAYLMLTPLADSISFFLASPSANRYAQWWLPAGRDRILQSIRYMTLNYPIDRQRIILSGVSDGATGCWAMANSRNEPFAGFVAISGFGGMLPQLGMQLSLPKLTARPIYNINAGLDHLYPVSEVNRFIDWCKSQGVNVTCKIYPDEKHGFDYRDKEYGTLAEIIRTWKKPENVDISDKKHDKITGSELDIYQKTCFPANTNAILPQRRKERNE